MTGKVLGALFGLVYIAAIVLANYLVAHVGLITVMPGLMAPAGVYCVGLTFPARDIFQRSWGPAAGIVAIVIAALLSWAISPVLAIASGVTFLVSETADFAVYTPLQRRWFTPAVIASGIVSAVVDSLLFLKLAHIPYSVALGGQITGKLLVVGLIGWPVALVLRRKLPGKLPGKLPVEVSA